MEDIDINELIAELNALRIQVGRLEAERDHGRATTNSPENTFIGLKVGDRVCITNRVRKPATWPQEAKWNEERERTTTVTSVTAEQVHFVTDNGTRTWCAPNNLRKITENSETRP
jgi:hypothetical protein